METRLFYVMYFRDRYLQSALDVIRFICNQDIQWPAHITVRGPYDSKQELDRKYYERVGSTVSVSAVRDFFQQKQNTVYLHCDSSEIQSVWDKPDWGYEPHITLYDGPSRQFARMLKSALGSKEIHLVFPTTPLSRLESTKGKKARLAESIHTMGISWLLRDRISPDDIGTLTPNRRIDLILRIWDDIVARHSVPSYIKTGSQQLLFPDVSPSWRSASRLSELHQIVVRAYLHTHQGVSVDRLIVDSSISARFVRHCWTLGLRESESTLLRALLRARKSGELGPVSTVMQLAEHKRVDDYLWGVEFAMRLLQDEEMALRGEHISIDRVLCDPGLSYRYEQLVRSIVPGWSSTEYRWAALILRKKGERRRSTSDPLLSFRLFGSNIRRYPKHLIDAPGVYWIKKGSRDLFVGESSEVKRSLSYIQQLRVSELPLLDKSRTLSLRDCTIRVLLTNDRSNAYRERLCRSLVQIHKPLLNLITVSS